MIVVRGIRRIHFDQPTDETATEWIPGTGSVLVLWPEPVMPDPCFEAAGFEEWVEGNDPEWDDGVRRLAARVVATLEALGDPRLVEGDYPVWKTSVVQTLIDQLLGRERPVPTLLDAVFVRLVSGLFGPCVVAFGDPPVAALRASHGHPVLWVWIAAGAPLDPATLLMRVSGGLPIQQTPLRWDRLLQGHDTPARRRQGG
jgi:hypothetical protein